RTESCETVKRIEGYGRPIVGYGKMSTTCSRAGVALGLDGRSICLEGDTIVVDRVRLPGARAAEPERGRVQLAAVGPVSLVGAAVKSRIAGGGDTPSHLDAARGRRREANLIVSVGRLGISAVAFEIASRAGPTRHYGIGALTVVPVTDLVGESDIQGMG